MFHVRKGAFFGKVKETFLQSSKKYLFDASSSVNIYIKKKNRPMPQLLWMHTMKQTHFLPSKSIANTYAFGNCNHTYSFFYELNDEDEQNKHLDHNETTAEPSFCINDKIQDMEVKANGA